MRLSALALLLALVGCQDAPEGDASSRPAVVEPAPTDAEPVSPGAAPPEPGEPGPVADTLPPSLGGDQPAFTTAASSAAVTSTGGDAPILRAVRIGRHEGFDRIVFEFDSDGLPQWHAGYIDAPVVHCGSGDEVAVEGAAWLQVRFSGANAHTEAGEGTSGEARRSVGLPSVREVVRTCDFEAEVTWVTGVSGALPYRPRVLTDPARLVIDVAHLAEH